MNYIIHSIQMSSVISVFFRHFSRFPIATINRISSVKNTAISKKDGRVRNFIQFCFQVLRENRTRIGKISSLPASISRISTSLERAL